MLAEINKFLLQERLVSTVTTEDEKEARYLILYKAYDVSYLLIYFPIKLTKSQFLFKISLYYC